MCFPLNKNISQIAVIYLFKAKGSSFYSISGYSNSNFNLMDYFNSLYVVPNAMESHAIMTKVALCFSFFIQ